MKKKLTARLLFSSIVITFAAFSISGSQCARVNDRVGIDSSLQPTGAVTACIKSCSDAAKTARDAENARFKQALTDCGTDTLCRQQAEIQHTANLELISDNMEACKDGCHEQGSGSGGQ